MKAAVYYENGGPEVLRYEDVPDPACPPNGVEHRSCLADGSDHLARDMSPVVRVERGGVEHQVHVAQCIVQGGRIFQCPREPIDGYRSQ